MSDVKTVEISDAERAFVTIPVLEIVPGWAVDDINTIDECDDAHVKIMALIAEIEYQIDMHDARYPSDRDYEWLARAKRALKFKKASAQAINNSRARIGRLEKKNRQETQDKRMIDLIRQEVSPEQFGRWVHIVTGNETQEAGS
jgi:hypothetical protein